jgi:hypothetical protein
VFYSQYQTLVCKQCGYAVAPSCLAGHISTKHAVDACRDAGLPFSQSKKPAARLAKRLREEFDILDPAKDRIPVPLPTEASVPFLKLYRGYKCTRCDYVLPERKRAQESVAKHFNQRRLVPRKPRRQPRVADVPEDDKGPMFVESHCQRLFVQGCQSSFFVVHVASGVKKSRTQPLGQRVNLVRAILDKQLHAGQLEQQAASRIYSKSYTKTEVSPWLEMTRWPRYFDGLDMTQVVL